MIYKLMPKNDRQSRVKCQPEFFESLITTLNNTEVLEWPGIRGNPMVKVLNVTST